MSEPEFPLRELTDKEIEAYERDGVVCLRGMLSDEWIEAMRAAVDATVQSPPPVVETFSRQHEGYTGAFSSGSRSDPITAFCIARRYPGSRCKRCRHHT
ncbi:MAG: hypothetical protein ACE5KS_10970 [Woeseiaceae bacterium]